MDQIRQSNVMTALVEKAVGVRDMDIQSPDDRVGNSSM